MSFTNSEQLYGVSSKFISGGKVGVLNGQGVLFTVNVALNSGAGASGLVTVYDALSGATGGTSGSTAPILFFNSGSATGTTFAPQPFLSGLNVQVSGTGLFVTVTYRAGL